MTQLDPSARRPADPGRFRLSTPKSIGNAIKAAHTPNLDRYRAAYPHTLIRTSGMDVGLPDGQMGNSEVGHTNIGAGRIVYQELTRITKAVEDGDFSTNRSPGQPRSPTAAANGTALHLFGLLSDGGVHSHNTHLYALLELAKEAGLEKVFVHCFFDGRDVPPDSAKGYTERARSQAQGNRCRRDCHDHGPLLCDGSRQPLGSCRKGLPGDGPGRRQPG